MFPDRSHSSIKDLLSKTSPEEVIDQLILAPSEQEPELKKRKRDGILPARKESSYSSSYRKWAKYHLLMINRHVSVDDIDTCFMAQQCYFTATLTDILSKIKSGSIKLLDTLTPVPLPPHAIFPHPPTLLKAELEAYSNIPIISSLKHAFEIRNAELVECQCCFSEYPLQYGTTSCKSGDHVFCFECVQRGLQAQMYRVESLPSFECKFMIDGCDSFFSTHELRRSLLPDVLHRMFCLNDE
jgi:hypothetical protein